MGYHCKNKTGMSDVNCDTKLLIFFKEINHVIQTKLLVSKIPSI